MAETTMEPWSFTIVFDEDKAKKNGYEVDTLYDYVGKNVEGLGNERIARGTWRAAKGYDEVDAQTLAISKLSRQKWVMQNIKSLAFREDDDEIYDGIETIRRGESCSSTRSCCRNRRSGRACSTTRPCR